MRWDAVGASIRENEAGYVAHVLQKGLSGMLVRGGRRRRYEEILSLDVGGREAAWVGFDKANDLVYVEGKGETTPDVVQLLRVHFPGHTCPRLDVCEDYRAPGSFELLREVIRTAAVASGKGSSPVLGFTALPDDPVAGRTWGNLRRGGVGFIRLYEPGKMAERAHWGLDAARVEGEFRPHTPAEKLAAASMTPIEVWGLTAWTRRVAEVLTCVEVPRFEPPASVYTQARTTQYLARTFRKHWLEMREDYGDWECIGREFEEVWRLDDEMQERLRAMKAQRLRDLQ